MNIRRLEHANKIKAIAMGFVDEKALIQHAVEDLHRVIQSDEPLNKSTLTCQLGMLYALQAKQTLREANEAIGV